MFPGLLPTSYSAGFLMYPRTICLEMALPRVGWVPHINYPSRKCLSGLLTGQADRSFSQLKFLLLR